LAAASLKLRAALIGRADRAAFRGHLAAASLKLKTLAKGAEPLAAFPRPFGRGLIEA
jgi:hypothetical protein